jgi:ubiquinone biosynthesis protein COQ9
MDESSLKSTIGRYVTPDEYMTIVDFFKQRYGTQMLEEFKVAQKILTIVGRMLADVTGVAKTNQNKQTKSGIPESYYM